MSYEIAIKLPDGSFMIVMTTTSTRQIDAFLKLIKKNLKFQVWRNRPEQKSELINQN